MTYFNLRKHEPEPEPDDVEEEAEDASEDVEETTEEEQPGRTYGPLLTGLFGPGLWLAARLGSGWAWGIHAVAAWAAGFYGGWVAVGVLLVWLLLVGLFTPSEALDRISRWIERCSAGRSEPDGAVTDAEAAAPDDPRTVLVGWLDELTRGRSGIHLDELHQALIRHPQLATLKRAEMRAWLDRHHITVDRTLRVGSVAGRSGVSRATVETLLKDPSPLLESGATESPVHASDVQGSTVESGVERGGEDAVRVLLRGLRGRLPGAP